ncbi:restriction endonuclease [Streptomyces lavenduligriseus]|uniref:Restriction endonuclease n=1 Tax=Streptomyces lavenduligriseus TaxID=67315 RepID=A0ABT0P574_9ACTN|nr:restriction endonuclease [Streptomyces lavenduligriseus]
MQRLSGTAKTVHGARFAVIVTNGRFTLPAIERSEAYEVHLIDRGRLELWAAEGRPSWELLEGVKPARRLPGQRRWPRDLRAAGWVPASGRQRRPSAQ